MFDIIILYYNFINLYYTYTINAYVILLICYILVCWDNLIPIKKRKRHITRRRYQIIDKKKFCAGHRSIKDDYCYYYYYFFLTTASFRHCFRVPSFIVKNHCNEYVGAVRKELLSFLIKCSRQCARLLKRLNWYYVVIIHYLSAVDYRSKKKMYNLLCYKVNNHTFTGKV